MYCDIPELGRCCFCLPLRRGVLVFGYLSIIFHTFLVGVYSYFVHYGADLVLVFHGATAELPGSLCLIMLCLEIVLNIVLLYGAHTKTLQYVRIYYYYTIGTIVATILLECIEIFSIRHLYQIIELAGFTTIGLGIQVYLLILVRSLVKKLQMDGPHAYDNQLEQIVNGEKIDNGVYNTSTVVPSDIV